jgi:glycosyltransferase involved in cell wall biosynthesis
MKIAIMMRAMDQDSGHQAIIMGLVENMLKLDKKNQYLLLYRTDKFLGKFEKFDNAQEKLITAPHKLLWDQVCVPYYAWLEKADVIYNPKFSVPLITHCPVVMGLHEPAWWAWPDHYEWFDRNYMKAMLPIYIKKSKHLFPISQFVVDECKKYIKRSFDNVTVAYPAPKDYFVRVENKQMLDAARSKYQLPEKFVLSVTRVDHPGLDKSDSFFGGKNPETTARAFIKCKSEAQVPHKLVIAGRRVKEYFLHLGMKEDDFKDIQFLDFVQHQDLPTILSLADLFVLPSYYESYAMALVEAMACGCPIVAAETGACPEITAGAALLANPYEVDDFAEKIRQVLVDEKLKKDLRQRGMQRSEFFTWDLTAKKTIQQIEKVVENRLRS